MAQQKKTAAVTTGTPRYWMISNRTVSPSQFGDELGTLTYWTSAGGKLDVFASWTQVDADAFQTALVAAADRFDPPPQGGSNADQSHVCFFVHGYNVGWQDNARRYQQLCADLFDGDDGLGLCVAFDWPSFGHTWDYLPDREHARKCAQDLATVLSALYDWLLKKQVQAAEDSAKACRAKVSLIAHSMGNYLTQKAMNVAWTRKNQPLLVTLINQLVMVAADVDNDLFDPGAADAADGTAVANLTYRATALYSGRDEVLGASAGLKHFGARRLGRSGLSTRPPAGKDNVWDVDCSSFFPESVGGGAIHSAYFETPATLELLRRILKGVDRGVLATTGQLAGKAWP
jgi:esterase/lipase superfamily enzyme